MRRLCFAARTAVGVVCLAAAMGCLSYHSGALPGQPASERGAFANLRGARVHFVDEGPESAPAVVLVHGFASSLGVWTGVREALRDDFRVVSLDLKGFGWSSRPEGDYSPGEQAELVLALMDARGIDQAMVVAHSWGSSVALEMALRAPTRVTRLAAYDAWVYAEQLPTAFHWARAAGLGEVIFGAFYQERAADKIALAFYDPEVIPQTLVDSVEEQLARPGTRAAALAAVRAMRYDAVQERYAEITAPTLLLWGEHDRVTPLEYGQRLYAQLPAAELRVYPRCGHFPMIEARSVSTRDLLAFLRSPTDAHLGPPSRGAPVRPSTLVQTTGPNSQAPAALPAPRSEPTPPAESSPAESSAEHEAPPESGDSDPRDAAPNGGVAQ